MHLSGQQALEKQRQEEAARREQERLDKVKRDGTVF